MLSLSILSSFPMNSCVRGIGVAMGIQNKYCLLNIHFVST